MKNEKYIYALGFFDGVHLGHQALLRTCCTMAESLGYHTAAITFDAHPQTLFSVQVPPLISSVDDRRRLLQHYGMETVRCLPVTDDVMSTDWEIFLEQLMDQNGAGFVCGDDFRFGHRGEGNAEKLLDF
jgi:riboflavin kinase/FMN adenylyltransferase